MDKRWRQGKGESGQEETQGSQNKDAGNHPEQNWLSRACCGWMHPAPRLLSSWKAARYEDQGEREDEGLMDR